MPKGVIKEDSIKSLPPLVSDHAKPLTCYLISALTDPVYCDISTVLSATLKGLLAVALVLLWPDYLVPSKVRDLEYSTVSPSERRSST